MMECERCGGQLDTGCRCVGCGHVQIKPAETSATLGTCSMGNGWCPLHGDSCPIIYVGGS